MFLNLLETSSTEKPASNIRDACVCLNLTMKVNRLELLKANIGLEMCAGFDEMQKYFDTILVDRVQEECERQSGILGETIKSNAKMAKSLVGASFNNASFSDRIWMYQGMLRSELSALLEQGIVQGKHANELARHLEKRFGVSKFSAQRLMRTEMARVQTEAQKQSFEQIGYKQYIFIAEHDSRTCSICGWLDGRTYKLSEMMPGTNAAPVHPMCRCSTAAYMDRRQFEKMVSRSKINDKTIKTVANNGLYGIIKENRKKLPMNIQFFARKSKQYGKKIGKHAEDFGLDPSIKEDRDKMMEIIKSIVEQHDEIRLGPWRGYDGESSFYIKGDDVVIKSSDGEFISILKGGRSNARVKNARIKEL